jgi:hypothetical protein
VAKGYGTVMYVNRNVFVPGTLNAIKEAFANAEKNWLKYYINIKAPISC